MAKKSKHRSVSITSGIAEAIEQLIEEVGFWPSVGAFCREACIKMIREERDRLGTGEEPPEGRPDEGAKERR